MASDMLAITTPAYSDPSRYELTTVTKPIVSDPTDVMLKVHAASINPVDVKKAAGAFKMALTEQYVSA